MNDLPLYEEIVRLKKERIPAALATVVDTKGSSPRKAGAKMIVRGDGSITGTIGGGQAEADTIDAALEVIRQAKPRTISFSLTEQHGMVCGGNILIYLEPLTVTSRLIVIGAGHVGQAIIQAARLAGFLVSLVNIAENKTGSTTAEDAILHPLHELDTLFDTIGADDTSYIVIATSNHHQDFVAVSAALKTDACYIGVLGSSKKRTAMVVHLNNEGFTETNISRIITPVGLEIGAETPEEIAISIVAQMIQVRRLGSATHSCHSIGSRAIAADGVQQTATAAG